jgi:hypothetical protein
MITRDPRLTHSDGSRTSADRERARERFVNDNTSDRPIDDANLQITEGCEEQPNEQGVSWHSAETKPDAVGTADNVEKAWQRIDRMPVLTCHIETSKPIDNVEYSDGDVGDRDAVNQITLVSEPEPSKLFSFPHPDFMIWCKSHHGFLRCKLDEYMGRSL